MKKLIIFFGFLLNYNNYSMVIALRRRMMMIKFLGLSLAVNSNKCSSTDWLFVLEQLALVGGHSILAYYDICEMYKRRVSFVCLCWFLVFGGVLFSF